MIFDVVFPFFLFPLPLCLSLCSISICGVLFRCFEKKFLSLSLSSSYNFCNRFYGNGTFIHSILKMERKHVSRMAFLVYFTSYFMFVLSSDGLFWASIQSTNRQNLEQNHASVGLKHTFHMHDIVKYRWRKLPSCMICNELSIINICIRVFFSCSPAMHSIQRSQNLKLSTAAAREK